MRLVLERGLYWMGLFESVMFFFFQAEDGIRDYKVTGVQTCALPIYGQAVGVLGIGVAQHLVAQALELLHQRIARLLVDRKSTRLNSSHLVISYAVFCLKKKKKQHVERSTPIYPIHYPSPLCAQLAYRHHIHH